MNQREPTSAPVGAGQALPCLALLLLFLLVVARAWSRPIFPQASALAQHKPYLVALGSPPLRFQEPAPPPDLTTRLAAGAPPQPSADSASSESAPPANPAASGSQPNSTTPSAPPTASSLAIDSASTTLTTDEAPVPARTPLPILPDELRPQARPEDFLPFFQIPVSRPGDVNVVVPVPRAPAAPAALPPSSATYTQTP